MVKVAVLKAVSAAIDGRNLALVIRFEREGEERLARWLGGDDWIERAVLDRLLAEAESVAAAARPTGRDSGAGGGQRPETPRGPARNAATLDSAGRRHRAGRARAV